jgi:hypothetical protein
LEDADTDRRTLVRSLDNAREPDLITDLSQKVLLHFRTRPFGTVQAEEGRTVEAGLAHELFLDGFVDSDGRGKYAGSGIWNPVVFQYALHAPIFTVSTMQTEESEIDQTPQLVKRNRSADATCKFQLALVRDIPQTFRVYLKVVFRGWEVFHRRVEVPDAAFVNVLPVYQYDISETVHKQWDRVKKGFIQVVVDCSASCERDFPFTGTSAEKDTDTQFGGHAFRRRIS